MLTTLIPVFPLPDVVLFPGVFLPLHIFELRYREMVKDCLAADRLIGISLLRPGWDHDADGQAGHLPGRLRRPHLAHRRAERRPLQPRASRRREVPGRAGGGCGAGLPPGVGRLLRGAA